MIKQLSIAAAIGLALSGTAFAEGAKAGAKAQGSATGDTTANAIARCDKLAGAEKANCLQEARRAADRSATGATSGGASGRAGANASASQPKDSAPSSPKAY
jgi:hypothetical protein